MKCFNEILSCGAKKFVLGVPVYDKQKNAHLEYAKGICEVNKTKYYIYNRKTKGIWRVSN